MRGLSFCIPNEYNRCLWEIFKYINLSRYTWYIDQEEVYYYNEQENKPCCDLFIKKSLTGTEFKECITKTDYYTYLANIQAYPVNSEKDNILTYDDFKNSKCEIILLCADSEYIDLYSKNEAYIKQVYEMCLQNSFKNVAYITDENDERTALRL